MHSHLNNVLFLLVITFTSLYKTSSEPPQLPVQNNPFMARAALIRYWNRHISSSPVPPPFFLSKVSPLTAAESAYLAKLAATNSLSAHLQTFCSLGHLFCSFEPEVVDADALSSVATTSTNKQDANFAVYNSKRFSDYGTSRKGGSDLFKNYSVGVNAVNESFKKYSKVSTSHSEGFANYASDGNMANGSFASYGFGAKGGLGDFKTYQPRVNVPNLLFTTYDSNAKDHKMSFTSYSNNTNSGNEMFTSYGKHGSGVPSQFISYGEDSNTLGSTFTGYNLLGNRGNDSFTNYGDTGNDPRNNFKSYSTGGSDVTDTFTNYRNGANVGDDAFQSYAQNANSAKATFTNYGKSFNPGNDTFKEYGKGSKGQTEVAFKSYSLDRTFKDYINKGVTFAGYSNTSNIVDVASGNSSMNVQVEEGRFFREHELREGNVMVMPNIQDKLPSRPFLPRWITSKLPFSFSWIADIREIFHAREDSATEHVIMHVLEECERAPSRGETKQCVASAEDMIDFAVSVLGHRVTVRTTGNTNGSDQKVMIGRVRGIEKGRVTKSVSCHQSLYPYLVYYCHSVPRVRVYEAGIIDPASGSTINDGVAICHLDTSAWSPEHGAFVALGHGPGQIEVCHWIFENDMTWTVADDD